MNQNRVRFNIDVSIEEKICRAIEKCDPGVVRRLLKFGVNINAQTGNGITPMHWACGLGDEAAHREIVQLLLSSNGNPNVKSVEGITPVHIAASWGFIGVLKILIANGGDPWIEDTEGYNAWDVALQKNQWNILKYLASYMEEDNGEPLEDSVQCVFVKLREVDLGSSLSSSSISYNNLGFLGSESITSTTALEGLDSIIDSTSSNTLNIAVCDSLDVTNASANSVIVVEEHIYSDTEKGVELVEWHYPPLVNQNSVTDATLNEALCTSSDDKNSVNWIGDSIDSQLLFDQLKSLGSCPGPITPTTKQVYLRQFFRLRREKAAHVPSPKRLGVSKELQTMLLQYPGLDSDTKIATNLDRLLVTHFTCPDPLKPWREGLAKKSFNYLLLDPRVTDNLPLNESQNQQKLFKRFVSSIFYIGKGKQTRPHEHLYEAIKLRSRPQSFLKVSKKVKRILDIWNDGYGVISIHVFQNSLPVEAFCREAAMIEAIGLSTITNVKRGDYYGICTSWSNSDKRRWGCLLLYKAFHILLHEGERQIRPVDL
ncbi:hypothetical protein GHT06_013303 [Daphnia sinensis]|uniref:LEM domain-containing protein n=1 Tax=Daphnia sinensis TaxID=1820382 RepID=A0AAD5LQY8_9CRUS|nr:hypothetical protein GHT06_013303 [Daphnia sinensis]